MISKLGITGLVLLSVVLIGMPTYEVWSMNTWTGLEAAISIVASLGLCAIFAGLLWVLAEVWK